jgi:biotin synthase-like enzyme
MDKIELLKRAERKVKGALNQKFIEGGPWSMAVVDSVVNKAFYDITEHTKKNDTIKTKWCPRHEKFEPITNFGKDSHQKDGFCTVCKEAKNAAQRKSYRKNRKKITKKVKSAKKNVTNMGWCGWHKDWHPATAFNKNRSTKSGLNCYCKTGVKEWQFSREHSKLTKKVRKNTVKRKEGLFKRLWKAL